MISKERLPYPVDLDDMNDQREQLENVMLVQIEFIERLLYQYQQETWLTEQLRAGLQEMQQAHGRLVTILNNGNLPVGIVKPR